MTTPSDVVRGAIVGSDGAFDLDLGATGVNALALLGETLLPSGHLRLRGTEVDDNASDGRVVVRGTGRDGPIAGSAVTLTLTGSANGTTFRLEATTPDDWQMAAALPAMAGSLAQSIRFAPGLSPRLVVDFRSTEGDPGNLREEDASQTTPVNLTATLDLAAMSAGLTSLLGVRHLPVLGLIEVSEHGKRAPYMAATATVADSVDLGVATAESVQVTLGLYEVFNPFYGRYSSRPYIRLAADVPLLDGDNRKVPVTIDVFDLGSTVQLWADLTDVTGALDDVLALAGGVDLSALLPDGLAVADVVRLDELSVELATVPAPRIERVSLDLSSPGTWAVVPDGAPGPALSVSDITVSLRVRDPAGTAEADVSVSGVLHLGDATRLEMSASGPEFAVGAWLPPDSAVRLDEVLREVLGDTVDVPALTVDRLELKHSAEGQRFELSVEGEWELGEDLAIDGVEVLVERGPEESHAMVWGRGRVGGVDVSVRAESASGAGWRFEGAAGHDEPIPLGTLLAELARGLGGGEADPLPDGLDGLTLEGIQVVLDTTTDELELSGRANLPGPPDVALTLRVRQGRNAAGRRTRSLTGEVDLLEADVSGFVTGLLRGAGVDAQVPVDVAVDRVEVEIIDTLHLAVSGRAEASDVRVDLWRRGTRWDLLAQVSGADLPDDLPLPAALASMLEQTTLRWASRAVASAPRPGLTPGPVLAGASMITVLPFHRTAVGQMLGLPSSPVPVEVGGGRLQLDLEHDLLAGLPPLDLEVLTFTALRFRYTAPAAVSLRLGVDLHLDFGDVRADLRFAGLVEADLTDRKVVLGIAFVGSVESGVVVPWQEPFGFPGLTVGALELWVGSGIRAIRGSLRVGRASLDVEAVSDAADPTRSAARFRAEALTLQDLLDGFVGADAPQLPGPLGATGFESVELEYAAGTFEFPWLTGTRSYVQGLRGDAQVNLFGLRAAATFDLEARRLAASVAPVALGSILRLEATTAVTPPPWAVGFSDLGGPFVTLDLGDNPSGVLSGKVTLFGAISAEVTGRFDDSGMQLRVTQELVTPVATIRTDMALAFADRAGVREIAFSGELHIDVELNPRKLAKDLLGLDVTWLDVDLLDIEVTIDVGARVQGTAVSGSLQAAFVLWGNRTSFAIAMSLDLDVAALGSAALEAVKNAALEAFRFFERLGAAIIEAVSALVDEIVKVGESIVEAIEDVGQALAAVGRAFTDLTAAIAELADVVFDEISSWFGDDSGKRERERARRDAERRHRRLQAEADAKRRAARLLEQNRRLLVLDAVENLADGATFDASGAAAVQRRIDTSDTHRLNPFTQTAEWDPRASRARHNEVWQDALARARSREALRDTYEAAMRSAADRLAQLRQDADRAQADLAAAQARHAAAVAELADLRRRRDDLLTSLRSSTELVLDAREGAVKVEIALDTAEALQGRLREEAAELGRDAEHLAATARFAPKAVEGFDREWAELSRLFGTAEPEVASAAALARRAEDDLAGVQAELDLVRASRSSLTLARLDAVQRSVGQQLGGIEAFGQWVDAVREAGTPTLVNVTSLRAQAEALLAQLPSMLVDAAGSAVMAAERVPVEDHSSSALAVPALVDAIGYPVAELEARRPETDEHARGFLAPWSLTAARIPLRGAVEPTPSRAAPDSEPLRLSVDPGAVLAWAETAPVGWAVAEAVRRDAWVPSVGPLVEALTTRWQETRAARWQLVEAELRVTADASLRRRVAEGRLIARRQWATKEVAARAGQRDLVVHLRRVDGHVTYLLAQGRGGFTSITTIDTTVRGRVRLNGEVVEVHFPGNLFVREYRARVRLEDVVKVVPFTIADEISSGIEDALASAERAFARVGQDMERVFATPAGQQRARHEVARLTEDLVAADDRLTDIANVLVQATTTWAGNRLGGVGLTLAVLQTTAGAGPSLDRLVGAAPVPVGPTGGPEARQAALQRLRDVGVRAAQAADRGHDPAAVGDEQLDRFVRWTRSLAAHADTVTRLDRAVDAAGHALDGHARALTPTWQAAVLALVAANGGDSGAAARAAVTESLARAEAALVAADPDGDALADLTGLTSDLRLRLAEKRSRLDAALERIGQLAVADTAPLEQEVARSATLVATADRALSSIDAVLAEVARDLARQDSGRLHRDTVAALGSLRMVVASSRDERQLRSAVERAHATVARLEAIGRAIEPVTGRFAEADRLLGDFATHHRAPSLAARLDAVKGRFSATARAAADVHATLPALFHEVLELIAAVRRRQQDLSERHRGVIEAAGHLAVETDRLLVERARLALVRAELESRRSETPPTGNADQADRVDRAAMAQVHDRLAELVRADAAQAEHAGRIRSRIVASAAHLSLLDEPTRLALDAARRLGDDEAALGAAPAGLLFPDPATASPVERRTPWPGPGGSAPSDPSRSTVDGWSVAFRVRAHGSVDAVLADGPLSVVLGRGVLSLTMAGTPGPIRVRLSPRVVHDVAVVVARDGCAVLWLDGVPTAHTATAGSAPTPAELASLGGTGTVWQEPPTGPQARRLGVADLRCWTRALTAEQVLQARTRAPDPAELELLSHSAPDELGSLGPPTATRPGVPDGTVLVRTARGDLVVTDGVDPLPPDVTDIVVGHGAGVRLDRGSAPTVESFVDVPTDLAAAAQSLHVLSLRPTLDARRWALEVQDDSGTTGLLAVAHDTSGRITTTGTLTTNGLFELTTSGQVFGRGEHGVSVRSSFTESLLRLTDEPICPPGVSEAGAAVAPVIDAPPAPTTGAVDDMLLTGAAGPRLVGPPVPVSVRLRYTPTSARRAFTLLRWTEGSHHYRLVVLAGRLHLVLDETRVVATSPPLRASRTATVTVRPGSTGQVLRVVTASRPASGRAAAGADLVDRSGTKVGTWHSVRVDPVTDGPARRTASFADITLGSGRRITVGPAPDPFHESPGAGTARGSLTAARPVRLRGGFAMAAWLRPVPARGQRPVKALWLTDTDGTDVFRLEVGAHGRAELTCLGQSARLPSLPSGQWSHVGVLAERVNHGTAVSVVVDGVQVAALSVPDLGGRWLRLSGGDRACAVNHVVLWDHEVGASALGRHLLLPSLPDGPPPALAWRLDADGDADGVIRGHQGVAAVLVDAARRVVAPGTHALAQELAERPARQGEPTLVARVVGRRHGRPSFLLAQLDGRRRRWLRWSAEHGFSTTGRSAEASVLSLRAAAIDRLDPDSPQLWHRLYGAPGEDATQLASTLGYPPVTGAAAARQRVWDEERRRALDEQVATERAWELERHRAIETADALLRTAWIEDRLPAGDPPTALAVTEDLQRVLDRGLSGLRLGTSEETAVRVSLLQAPPADQATVTYWVGGDIDPPSGLLVAVEGRQRAQVLSVAHLAPGAGRSVPAVEVTVAGSRLVLDAPVTAGWHHVALTWRARDGRVRLRVDGGRAVVGSVGAGARLDAQAVVVAPTPNTPGATSFRGRVEQVAMWPIELGTARLRQVRRAGADGRPGEVDLVTPSTVDPDSTCTWWSNERSLPGPTAAQGGTRHPHLIRVPDPPPVELLARWETVLTRAARSGQDASAGAPTGLVSALLGQVPRGRLRVDTLHRALAAAYARPTRAALEWDLEVWAVALAGFAVDPEAGLRARFEAVARTGVEVRTTPAADARELGRALQGVTRRQRRNTARKLGWTVADPRDEEAPWASAGAATFGRLLRGTATSRDVGARRLGLEPIWAPLPDVTTTRRDAVRNALDALRSVPDPRPSAAELAAGLGLDLVMLVPLSDGGPDDRDVTAVQRAVASVVARPTAES